MRALLMRDGQHRTLPITPRRSLSVPPSTQSTTSTGSTFQARKPRWVLQPRPERDVLPGGRGAYRCLTARFRYLARPLGFGPVALFSCDNDIAQRRPSKDLSGWPRLVTIQNSLPFVFAASRSG